MYPYLKQWLFMASMVLITLFAASCNSTSKKTNSDQTDNTASVTTPVINTNELSMLYFHATRRCATCEAVEKVAKQTLTEFYSDSIAFYSINREEQKELASQYNVEWQTLLIVKGDKKVNLTNEAFLNARTNPDKLKAQIHSAIDSLK